LEFRNFWIKGFPEIEGDRELEFRNFWIKGFPEIEGHREFWIEGDREF